MDQPSGVRVVEVRGSGHDVPWQQVPSQCHRPRVLMADAEFSAGGVVIDPASDPPACIVIVPTRRAADGSKVLTLPKGHPDGSESPEAAALREVREETGVVAIVRGTVGDVRYVYQRSGRRIAKVVRFFLMEYAGGSLDDHDHEVEVVRWVPLEEAMATLSYPGERRMVELALAALGNR